MVFRIQARLLFANAAARNAGRTTIQNAISGRDATVIEDWNLPAPASGLYWEAESDSTGDAGTIYALIQAMSSPLAGSRAHHHTCRHGDLAESCIPTAQKVW